MIEVIIEGVGEAVASLQGWKLLWSLFLARENPKLSPSQERWRDVLLGGSEFTYRELLTLAETLFLEREEGSLSHSKALPQLTAHLREIITALDLPDDLRLPNAAREVTHFETKELQPHMRAKVLHALQQRGIGEEELWGWLQGERGLRVESTEEQDDE